MKNKKEFQIYLKGEDKTRSVRDYNRLGEKYEVTFNNGRKFTYNAKNVRIIESALKAKKSNNCFEYLKSIAKATGLKSEVSTGKFINLLEYGYSKINFVLPDSVLAAFLSGKLPTGNSSSPRFNVKALFPFGFNASQKEAVDKALKSHVSIIEGPPGTGKTQTILNIITNIVMRDGSVAVVSSNNSAIKNVLEKLQKYNIDFIAANLGSKTNREDFISSQKPLPEIPEWGLDWREVSAIKKKVSELHNDLEDKLAKQNELAALQQKLDNIEVEEKHFLDYFGSVNSKGALDSAKKIKSTEKAIEMWLLSESIETIGPSDGLIKRLLELIRNLDRNRRFVSKLLAEHPREYVVASFQKRVYELEVSKFTQKVSTLEKELKSFDFSAKMSEHSDLSAKLFREHIYAKYRGKKRKHFELDELKSESEAFIKEYPVILSTTYSLRNSLASDVMYDYVIIDESSQVDLCTGALALSCARNTVIVGDTNQLTHVVDSKTAEITDDIFEEYELVEAYRYKSNSLLSAMKKILPSAPVTLLREHYRCHPKIIEFCNRKFYDGQLIVLTEPQRSREPLVLYKTVRGTHERNRVNQRQIDVIKNEVIPQQNLSVEDGSLGIVTPYRKQTNALQDAFAEVNVKADTVNSFQGQECPVIILSTVDNEISEFTDNANRLNVAISRAVDQLVIVVNDTDTLEDTNLGDLVKYIEYNNLTIVESKVRSVFDYLFSCYAEQRRKFLSTRKRVSEYDSENLMNDLISEVLREERFRHLKSAVHFSLRMIVRDLGILTPPERKYAEHRNAHVDFLIFDPIANTPRLVVEVDGVSFHAEGTRQAERDKMKDEILRKCGLPILRLRTDGSGERDKLTIMLDESLR